MITSWTSAHRNIGYGRIAAIGALLLLAQPLRIAAQSSAHRDAVRVHLTVAADEGCATEGAIAEQVRKRSRRIEFVADPRDVPRLHVAIGAGAGGDRVAQLSLEWPDGRRSERHLTAASCAAALDALALLVAMTLDPAALSETASAPATPPQRGRASERAAQPEAQRQQPGGAQPGGAQPGAGTGDAAATAAAERAAAEEVTPASPDAAPDPARQPDAAATAQGAPVAGAGADREPTPAAAPPHPFAVQYVAAGASAQLVSGLAPRAMPGFGLYALLAFEGAGAWAPALGVSLSRTWVDGVSEPGGDADFELYAAELDACALGLRLSPLSARACAAGAVGSIGASGSNSYTPQSHRNVWAGLGGALLVSLGLGSVAELEAGLAVTAPLRRYRFAFRPDVFHQVGRLSVQGHLGAGVRFP